MVERGLVTLNSEERSKGKRNHCEFHNREGHRIQECTEFRAMVQNLMDNKEMEFYEEIEGSEEREVYASEEGSMEKVQKGNRQVVIISKPRVNEARIQVAPRVIIQKPAVFPYRDSKRVPCNYDCNVTIRGKENPASASKEHQDIGSHTRSGRRYDLVKGKAPMVEQEKEKSVKPESPVNEPPTRISVLALLQSSEVHRNALMKVLNETYVANDISVSKLDRLIISFTSAMMKFRRVAEDLLKVCILPLDAKAGVVPSLLHQKLKLVSEGRLVTINVEEDIITAVTNDAPYLEMNDEVIEWSFRSLEFVNTTFIMKGKRILVPKIFKSTRMGLQMTIGKGALPGK
ncbi:aldehyde dehydrogenase family 2 member C4-like [Gossypium australe]|uniref:Aldehyde dehydrogenase family 2 member C4-like n=1 Tax=Gossypium australe TaxID=47621 RepID=A0A5B6X1M1_9ROSI|nr:aldehyde dehydrogenase family 2 member C4-like [Gossypium australe]